MEFNKSKKITLLGTAILASTISLAYAGFTEINSSGDIISNNKTNASRTSFSNLEQNIQVPSRSFSLWDKISETTKYNATVKENSNSIIVTPLAIESTQNTYSNTKPYKQLLSENELQAELKKTKEALRKSEESNNKLKYENLDLQVKLVEINKDMTEVKQHVNFLASQMEKMESELLVLSTKKPTGFLARN